jgi:hypothetical protein
MARSRLLAPRQGLFKPGVGSQIDWSHPLANRLCYAGLFNEVGATQVQNLVSQARAPFTGSTGPSWVGGQKAGLSFPGGANTVGYLTYGVDPLVIDLGQDTSHPATFAFRVWVNNAGVLSGRNDGNTISPGWQITFTGTNVVIFFKELTAGNASITASIATGRWMTIVIAIDGSNVVANQQIWIDSVSQTLGGSAGSGTAGSDSAETFYVGRGNANYAGVGNGSFDGTIDWFYIWKRKLSPAEILQVTATPYSFIRDPLAIFTGATPASTDIAFDAATGSNNASSYTHVTSGANRILFVANRAGAGAPTYNGVALTLIQALTLTGATGSVVTPLQLWGLVNPALGSNTVVNGSSDSSSCALSINNAKQSLSFDATVTNESAAGATSLTTSVTTITDRSMVICAEAGYFFGAQPLSGTNLTFRAFANALGIPGIFSSPVITPAGATNFQTQLSGNAGDKIAHILVAVAPTGGAAPIILLDVPETRRPPRARQVRSF